MAKLGTVGHRFLRKQNESMRHIISTIVRVVFGFLIGTSFPTVSITKLHFCSSIISYIEDKNSGITTQALLNHAWSSANSHNRNQSSSLLRFMFQQIPEVLRVYQLVLLIAHFQPEARPNLPPPECIRLHPNQHEARSTHPDSMGEPIFCPNSKKSGLRPIIFPNRKTGSGPKLSPNLTHAHPYKSGPHTNRSHGTRPSLKY